MRFLNKYNNINTEQSSNVTNKTRSKFSSGLTMLPHARDSIHTGRDKAASFDSNRDDDLPWRLADGFSNAGGAAEVRVQGALT